MILVSILRNIATNEQAHLLAGVKINITSNYLMSEKNYSKRWFWMMDYCEKQGTHPAETWAWERAAIAYFCANIVNKQITLLGSRSERRK